MVHVVGVKKNTDYVTLKHDSLVNSFLYLN